MKYSELAKIIVLQNANGTIVEILNYGARIISWKVKENEKVVDVALGYSSIEDYLFPVDDKYHGATIGRFANRIANAKLSIEGVEYKLSMNNELNCLHGGVAGFDSKFWNIDSFESQSVVLSLISPDGDEGFPGEIKVWVTFLLTDDDELVIDYSASTNKPTYIGLTNHLYFNLAGRDSGELISNHKLKIYSDRVYLNDANYIPYNCPILVNENSNFDFRNYAFLGEMLERDEPQFVHNKGYNHSFVVERELDNMLALAAILYHPASNRKMTVYTTEPIIHIYTGSFFDGTKIGLMGEAFDKYGGIALEAGNLPNAPNREDDYNLKALLLPNQLYKQTTIYKIQTKNVL